MNIWKKMLSILVIAMVSTAAFGSEFCDGFKMGYKTVRGNNVLVPLCPLAPLTPLGSTPYQEGLKKGIEAAHNGY
jgi:hypothetical protein